MLDLEDARSLRTGVAAQAARTPGAPAVLVGGTTLTYGELDERARRLAAVLTDGGRRRLARVGVYAYRSETAYVATLAALYAGAAFVPLNQRFPVERTRAMIRRARLDAIVVDAGAVPQLAEALRDVEPRPPLVAPTAAASEALQRAAIAGTDAATVAAAEPLQALPPVLPDDLAYLLFTSGTTGEPKGVGVTNANALHFLDAAAARYPLGPDDRCSQTFDQTFDLAVFDLFMAWNAGACLVVPQPIELLAPVRFVQKHALTLWFSVPSVAALAVKKSMLAAGAMPSLRFSLFCGEPLPEATAGAWHQAAPQALLENLYGPTELTIACFAFAWAPDRGAVSESGIMAIGRPLPGLGALVVDDALRPLPEGEVGELLVCGPQTAPGYWLDPEKTAERFVTLTLEPGREFRFYRTGDRVRRTPGGDYVYVGRTDNQVKVMGFRVELGEIETVLLRQPGVVEAIAAGWPMEDGSASGIVAFVSGSADAAALPQAVARQLPDYMVPRRVVQVDEMPLNANGKIDRRALLRLLEDAGAAT